MCRTIYTPDGQELETPAELHEYLGREIEWFVEPCYKGLHMNACFCQVDLRRSLNLAGIPYTEGNAMIYKLKE